MRGLDRARGTGGTGGNSKPFEVESDDKSLAFDMVDVNVGGVRNAIGLFAVEAGVVDLAENAGFEPVTHGRKFADTAIGECFAGDVRSLTQTYDAGKILSPRAPLAFVIAADDPGTNEKAFPKIQSTDTLGTMHLVGGDGQRMAADLIDVNGNLAGGLNSVRMKDQAVFLSDLADLFDRLENAGLIVCHHHAYVARVRTQSGVNGFRTDDPA